MALGITFPICLVGGLIMLIFGATQGIPAMLGVGIALVVVGFYGTPLAWVQFGQKCRYDRIVKAIMVEHILDVNAISLHTDIKLDEVVNTVKKAINLGDLEGLTLIGDSLQSISLIAHPNADEVFDGEGVEVDVTCPYCGGTTATKNEKRVRCEYCGKMIERNQK